MEQHEQSPTEPTRAEIERVVAEATRLMSQRGDLLLNAIDDGIYCLDPQGRTMFVNEAGARMLGYTLREMLGKPQHTLIHHHYADGSDFPVEACPIHLAVTEGVSQRVDGDVFWRKNGTPLPIAYTCIPLKEGRRILGAVVTFRDVSAERDSQRQAERLAAERAARAEAERGRAELAEAEVRFNLALEAGQMGTWEWDIAGGRVIWSAREERMYGLEPGSFSGSMDEYRERIHPDDREAAIGKVQQALAGHATMHHVLHRIVRPDGEIRWLESHGRFIYADDGTPLRLTGVSTDVTDRRPSPEPSTPASAPSSSSLAPSR